MHYNEDEITFLYLHRNASFQPVVSARVSFLVLPSFLVHWIPCLWIIAQIVFVVAPPLIHVNLYIHLFIIWFRSTKIAITSWKSLSNHTKAESRSCNYYVEYLLWGSDSFFGLQANFVGIWNYGISWYTWELSYCKPIHCATICLLRAYNVCSCWSVRR